MAPASLAGVAAPPPRLAAFRPARSSSSLARSRRGAAVLVCGDGEARNADLRSAADAALECALSSHPARLLPASVLQQCCGRAPWRCQAPASPCRPSTLSSRVAARAWAGRWRPSSCGPATTWSSALATVGNGLRRLVAGWRSWRCTPPSLFAGSSKMCGCHAAYAWQAGLCYSRPGLTTPSTPLLPIRRQRRAGGS